MKYLKLFEDNRWWEENSDWDKFGEEIDNKNKSRYTVRDYYNLLSRMVGINFVKLFNDEDNESESLWFGVNYPGTISLHKGGQSKGGPKFYE